MMGKRVRENFDSKADALERMSALEFGNAPDSATIVAPALQRTTLSKEQISDAESASALLPSLSLAKAAADIQRWEKRCAAVGLSIDAAIAFCESRYHPELKEASILVARDLFLASRRNIRQKTREHYESATKLLLKKDPNKLVHRFTVDDLDAILAGYSNQNTYLTYRRCFSTFFRWARQKRMCVENPCERLDSPPPNETRIAILSLAEVVRLLGAATAYRAGVLVAPLAIALFAGLRPSEIEDLKPENVSLEKIRVTGGKLRRTLKRTVPVSSNLAQWLKAYPFNGIPKNFSGKLRTLRKVVKADRWVQDVLRHTSISFQLERDKNEALTAFANGTSVKTINFHYREVIAEEDDVVKFWNLSPETVNPEAIPEGLPKASTLRWPSDTELRHLIQANSLLELSRQLGISDVGIRKHCLRRGIAVPNRSSTARCRSSA